MRGRGRRRFAPSRDDAAEQVTQALLGEPLRVEERARRLGAGAHGLRLPGLGARRRARGRGGRAACRRGRDAGRRRALVPRHAVPLGRHDRARGSTARARPHGVPPARPARPARRRPAGGRRAPRWPSRGRGDLVTYGERRSPTTSRSGSATGGSSTRPGARTGSAWSRSSSPSLCAPAAQARSAVITWARSDGREEGGERVVPAASTIKLFVASAFWRSELDPAERVEVAARCPGRSPTGWPAR